MKPAPHAIGLFLHRHPASGYCPARHFDHQHGEGREAADDTLVAQARMSSASRAISRSVGMLIKQHFRSAEIDDEDFPLMKSTTRPGWC